MSSDEEGDRDQALVTILIPTVGRPQFLRRALSYYRSAGFLGQVIVGDSSAAADLRENARTVAAVSGALDVVHRHFPADEYVHDGACMKEMLDLARTPYALYAGDDDLVVLSGLGPCVRFLSCNPDYAAVHGCRINVRLDRPGAQGTVVGASLHQGLETHASRPTARWAEYLASGVSTQYFLHRTATWRRMYRDVPGVRSRYLGPELLPCSFTALLGKIQRLEVLTTLFQRNERPVFSWEETSLRDLMRAPEWRTSVAAVRRAITGALVELGGATPEGARVLFARGFGGLMRRILRRQASGRSAGTPRPPGETERGLRELLAASSPYRAELLAALELFAGSADRRLAGEERPCPPAARPLQG